MTSSNKKLLDTDADIAIRKCLDISQSFSVIAGAGSGKTTSLVEALKYLREKKGQELRRDAKKIACITYTNRAVNIISSRLEWDELFLVSTLHAFLWQEVKRYTPDVRTVIANHIIPKQIEKKEGDDNGGNSKKAQAARLKIQSLKGDLEKISDVSKFKYNDTNFSNYSEGLLSHDDVINISAYLIQENEPLRKILGQKYPYIFVDEAQDTFSNVVEALNKLCEKDGLPIVGYFGDPMQQIYEKRAGDFIGPKNSKTITKVENFRCSTHIIKLLNAFREDVEQVPAGENRNIDGSVLIKLIAAETPKGERKRYTEEQTIRASQHYDKVVEEWEWHNKDEVKSLFLVRQMIARRLGFPEIQKLFTGQYASTKAQEDYEKGDHFLLKPFVSSIYHLVIAQKQGDFRKIIDILRRTSSAFDPLGINTTKTLGEMKGIARSQIEKLAELWSDQSLGTILKYCRENKLCYISDRLSDHLDRDARVEEYKKDEHSNDKSDWLVDAFLNLRADEIKPFIDFVTDNTPLSTQHGVKGEEYKNVIVVFDDTDAAWNTYNFIKMLTPNTSGDPTDGQRERSRKLAYVCFSRAEENLRILLFTPDPRKAKIELIENNLFEEHQVSIAG
jgi:DNA helicase-2/ATP-dependent DNA helicase PcrA